MSTASPSVAVASNPPSGAFKRYQEELPDDISAVRRVLEHYSGILSEAVEDHIRSVVCVTRLVNASFYIFNPHFHGFTRHCQPSLLLLLRIPEGMMILVYLYAVLYIVASKGMGNTSLPMRGAL